MDSVQNYHKISGDNIIKKIIRKLAFNAGYICVPSDYPLWLTKTASSNNLAAKIYERDCIISAANCDGQAKAYNIVAQEINDFGKL